MPSQSSPTPYCFWDALSLPDTILITVYSAMALVLLLKSCQRLIKFILIHVEEEDSHLRTCFQIHILTALWGLTFLIEKSYEISIFFLYLDGAEEPTEISSYSKTYTILDKIPQFIIQTIFIKICLFSYKGIFRTIPAQYLKINHKFFKTYLPALNYFRLLFISLGVVSLIIFQGDDQIWITSFVSVIIQILDSFQVFMVLIYSMRQLVFKGLREEVVGPTIRKQIKIEYYLMIVSSFLGVFLNLVFLIYTPFIQKRVSDACLQPVDKHWDFFIGHNLIGIPCLHLIPAIWFLTMYNYKGKEDQRGGISLLTQSEHVNNLIQKLRQSQNSINDD